MAKRTKKTSIKWPSRKYTWAGVAGLVLVLGIIYFGFIHKSSAVPSATTGTTADGKKVNLSPATASDKQSNDTNKQAIVSRDEKLGSSSAPQTTGVQLVITDVSSGDAKAYVQGVFEDGGSCSASATQGSQTITGSSSGFENVSYTQCAPLNWQTPLGAGSWSVKVTYKSNTTEVSAEKTVQL